MADKPELKSIKPNDLYVVTVSRPFRHNNMKFLPTDDHIMVKGDVLIEIYENVVTATKA